MYLIIDSGNTSVKTAVYDGAKLLELHRADSLHQDQLDGVFQRYRIEAAIHCSVRDLDPEIEQGLAERTDYRRLHADTPLPITNRYASPKTLGYDRIAAVVGGWERFPGEDILVIDAGTCITYDFLSAAAQYSGGSISPGIELRFQALHNYTDTLPLVAWRVDEPVDLVGSDTATSIRSGVIHGIAFEMDGQIDAYKQGAAELKVLVTGGQGAWFESLLKNRIFAYPNLVLRGLSAILDYNVRSR